MTERNNSQKLSLVCEKRLVFVLLTQKTAREIIHHEVPFQHYPSKLFQLHSKHIQLPVQPVQLPRGGSFARNFTLAWENDMLRIPLPFHQNWVPDALHTFSKSHHSADFLLGHLFCRRSITILSSGSQACEVPFCW